MDRLLQADLDDRDNDRVLKRQYAKWFIGILIVQLVVMNVVFVLAGRDSLFYDQWVLELYMAGTLTEVFFVVKVITKSLFQVKIP